MSSEWIEANKLTREDLLALNGWKIDQYSEYESPTGDKWHKGFCNGARVALHDFRTALREGVSVEDLTKAREWQDRIHSGET